MFKTAIIKTPLPFTPAYNPADPARLEDGS